MRDEMKRELQREQRNAAEPGAEGGRRPTEAPAPETQPESVMQDGKRRWTVSRKREAVLRLLRGEPVAELSRELGVEIYRLEEWRERALAGIDTSLKERDGDPLQASLDSAMKRIGELTMDNELLWMRMKRSQQPPLASRRPKK